MEREQSECYWCGTMVNVEIRAGRGIMWTCDKCHAEFSRQCRRMDVILPDDLDEQIAAITSEDQTGGVITENTSIEAVLCDVTEIGPSTIENIRSHGFETAEELRSASPAALQQIDGVGEELATRILEHLAATGPTDNSEETDESGLGDLFG